MSDQENSIPVQSPAEAESVEPEIEEPIKPAKPFATKFSIWPPTQRTRDAVINRLIETLSAPSILSKRYGTIPPDEADAVARDIEKDSYATADDSPATEGDGIEILQLYSKEISKRMLEAVKARPIPSENGEKEGLTSPVVPSTDETPSLEIQT